jgi:hypothetical protein
MAIEAAGNRRLIGVSATNSDLSRYVHEKHQCLETLKRSYTQLAINASASGSNHNSL